MFADRTNKSKWRFGGIPFATWLKRKGKYTWTGVVGYVPLCNAGFPYPSAAMVLAAPLTIQLFASVPGKDKEP